MGNFNKTKLNNQEWETFSPTSGNVWSAPARCEFSWSVSMPPERQLSSTSLSSVRSSTPSQQLDSMLRPSNTRTFHSMCGMSVVRIRSDFSGDTITPTLRVSSMSSTPTIEIELKRTVKSSTRCLPRKSLRTPYCSYLLTSRTCQVPLPAQKSPINLAFTPSEEEHGSSNPPVP